MTTIEGLNNIPKQVIGIYKITNKLNNKCYIGQSKDIYVRIKKHLSKTYEVNSAQYSFQIYQALRKYGIGNFKVEVLEECDADVLNEREIYWIQYYDSFKNGYNATLGGDYMPPSMSSEEIKAKRIASFINNDHSGEKHPRAKLSNEEVVHIRQRYIDGESVTDIYKDYDALYPKIEQFRRIIFGRSYTKVGNIPQKSDIRYTNKNRTNGKIPKEIIIGIRTDYASGNYSLHQLEAKYGINFAYIHQIIKRRVYRNI